MAFFEDLPKDEILSGDVLTGLAIGGAAPVLVVAGRTDVAANRETAIKRGPRITI